MTQQRELDVVLYGATGFVGRLTAEYLAASAGGASVALAARSAEKLGRLKAELGEQAAGWPLIVADAGDDEALAAMAARAKVVATTVGPYRKYGTPLVRACAEAGTHYADLTGEPLFIRDSIDSFDRVARESGARIVHACGFDSIPSDIGVMLLGEAAGPMSEATLVVRRMKGGIGGGTVDSFRGVVDEVRADRSRLRTLLDPYALSPDRAAEPDLGSQRDKLGVERSGELSTWLAPFVMAPINTRVVRRSNALTGWAYGRGFRYREVMATGAGASGVLRAALVAGGTGALAAGLALPPTRFVLDRVLPEPGEGPSMKSVRNGSFAIEIHAVAESGERWVCRESGKGDPAFGSTSLMLGESALCLALDGERLPDASGVLTPATAMGVVLADRLRAAGQAYEVSRA